MDELGAIGVVGVDAADLGGREIDHVDPVGGEEPHHRGLVEQVEVAPVHRQDRLVAEGAQAAHDRRAHHPAMAGHENGLVAIRVHHAPIPCRRLVEGRARGDHLT